MAQNSLEALPFFMDVCGRFASPTVRVLANREPRPTCEALERLISAEWERQTVLAKQADRLLFNGELLRYVRHRVYRPEDDAVEQFELVVGPTCYRDFVGTNLFNRHRVAEFGWPSFANPIGTTATLITREGRICYGRRSGRVAYHANHVHTFGGALEPGDCDADGGIDAFGSVARELLEEVGLRGEELPGLGCVGLIRDKEIHQPEMLFEARIDLTADELRRRWEGAEARDEHDAIVDLADEPDAIVPFINGCGPIAPVAVGALFIHGRLSWGEAWFEQAAGELRANRH